MKFTAKAIADFLNGEIEGDANVEITSVSKIEEGKPGTLSFLANPKYTSYIYTTLSSIVLVNKDFKPEKKINSTLIRVEDAYQAFASLLELYNKNKFVKQGVEDYAFIDSEATIGKGVYIASFAYISKNAVIGDDVKIFPHVYIGENVKIDNNTILYSGVKIYYDCRIGKNCILHSGVIIGSDGFGFAQQHNSDFKKIPQLGNVIIEDNVEIGSNTTIDRATIGSTMIRRGVKLDNLIQIAHNVEVGENTVIVAQSGIAGSTKIGKDCIVAAQAGIVGHINIADKVVVGAQAGVTHNIKDEGAVILGSPAINMSDFKKSIVIFKQLPDLRKKILELEKQIQELKNIS